MGTCPLMRFRLVIFTLFSIGSSLVSADGRECNYIIRPESDGDKNTTYIGMVFSQITPPINESVLISYTWEGIRYVDEHYSAIEENNLVPKTK